MSRQRGFTLLEVLVAIALASLLLSSVYGIFSTTSEAKQQVEAQAGALHLGRVFSARLNRELLGLAINQRSGEPLLAGGRNRRGEPFLELLTSSSGSPDPALRRVRYRLAPGQDNRMTLWRSEQGANSVAEASEERLAQGISGLTFGFYDGAGWRNDWNSSSDGRPVLVRAEIELQELSDRPPLISVFELSQPGGADNGE